MNISNDFIRLILLLTLSFFTLISCETEDILPAVALTVDANNLSENSQSVVLTATLNSNATENITIPVTFTGTASSSDYTTSASSISISLGNLDVYFQYIYIVQHNLPVELILLFKLS